MKYDNSPGSRLGLPSLIPLSTEYLAFSASFTSLLGESKQQLAPSRKQFASFVISYKGETTDSPQTRKVIFFLIPLLHLALSVSYVSFLGKSKQKLPPQPGVPSTGASSTPRARGGLLGRWQGRHQERHQHPPAEGSVQDLLASGPSPWTL